MANIENTIAKFEADKQADFLNDKINREVKPCDDNDEVWELIPDVSELNDVEDAPTDEALDFDIEEWKAAFADYRAKKKRMQKEINQLELPRSLFPPISRTVLSVQCKSRLKSTVITTACAYRRKPTPNVNATLFAKRLLRWWRK